MQSLQLSALESQGAEYSSAREISGTALRTRSGMICLLLVMSKAWAIYARTKSLVSLNWTALLARSSLSDLSRPGLSSFRSLSNSLATTIFSVH